MPTILIEYGPTNDGRHLIRVGGHLMEEHTKAGACKAAAEQLATAARSEYPGVAIKVSRRYFTSSVSQSGTEAKAQAAQAALDNADVIAELMELTNDELADTLADGAHDDYLDAIEAAEKAKDKPRIGALHYIEDRRLDILAEAKVEVERKEAEDARILQFATEIAVLATDLAELLAAITDGKLDAHLDTLIMLEAADEGGEARQPVLDALSDRSVAKAQEDAYQAKWATVLAILDSQALLDDIAAGAHDSQLDTLIGVEAEKQEPRAEVLAALTSRNEAIADAAAKKAEAAKAASDAADAAAADEAKKTAATTETKPDGK